MEETTQEYISRVLDMVDSDIKKIIRLQAVASRSDRDVTDELLDTADTCKSALISVVAKLNEQVEATADKNKWSVNKLNALLGACDNLFDYIYN